MKKILIALTSLLIANISYAQMVAMLHHQGVSTPYYGNSGFTDAYTASVGGDTIYLPGKFYNCPSEINKRLYIVGAGHYPDSTIATNRTTLNSGFSIGANADSLKIEGLYINGSITFNSDVAINNVTIKRNYINGSISINGDRVTAPCYFVFINENIINGDMYCSNALQSTIANNIILNILHTAENCLFINNVIFGCPYWGWPHYTNLMMYNINNCVLENNIFSCTYPLYSCNNNTFSNNIFTNSPSFGTNVNSNNFQNVTFSNIFNNVLSTTFNYSYNFHLQSPGDYIGTDGVEVGLYGGLFGPYKEGAVPFNPHIQSKTIAPTTDSNGNLNINIKVAAQEK